LQGALTKNNNIKSEKKLRGAFKNELKGKSYKLPEMERTLIKKIKFCCPPFQTLALKIGCCCQWMAKERVKSAQTRERVPPMLPSDIA
jgi:hypothetical protein